MAGAGGVESVFLNIPYDAGFEDLYLAYIVGLTQFGLRTNAALAVPNQGRLNTIIKLIEGSDLSIHDLSRIFVGQQLHEWAGFVAERLPVACRDLSEAQVAMVLELLVRPRSTAWVTLYV